MNHAVALLIRHVDPALLQGEVNALRLTLHPQGLAPKILNLVEWRDHILRRLRHDIDLSADPRLTALHDELLAYPLPKSRRAAKSEQPNPAIAIPMMMSTSKGRLSFLSATTVFGTAVDVTLSEIVIETFLPSDQFTANVLRDFSATYLAD